LPRSAMAFEEGHRPEPRSGSSGSPSTCS
jgi:hypothetical protein